MADISSIQLAAASQLGNNNLLSSLGGQNIGSLLNSTGAIIPTVSGATTSIDPTTNSGPAIITGVSDTRVRLRAFKGQESQVYGTSGLLSVINPKNTGGTDGLLFPYTPQINVTQAVDYGETALVHSNQSVDHFIRAQATMISLTAKFTIQNQREGRYALAALHFLRVVSKMYFGDADKASGKAGLPPPVLIFSGYGDYMFDNLPVIVRSHTYSFDDSMDMVTVNAPGGIAKLPALFQVSIELKVQQTPNRMRTVFSLDSFRTGKLMQGTSSAKTGWI